MGTLSSWSAILFACVLGSLSAPMYQLQGSDPSTINRAGPAIATLGIFHDVPDPERFDMGLSPSLGREIQTVYPGSTAEAIGVRPGDVIIGINGIPVTDGMSMRYELINSAEGDPIHLKIWRDGNEIDLSGKIGPGKEEWRTSGLTEDITEGLEDEREYRAEQRERIKDELQKLSEDQRHLRDQISKMKQELSDPQSVRSEAESTSSSSAWILHWRMLTNDALLLNESKPQTPRNTTIGIVDDSAIHTTIPKDR